MAAADGSSVIVIDKVRQLNSRALELFEKGKGGKGFTFVEEGLSELAKNPNSFSTELAAQYCFLASLHLRGATGNQTSPGFQVVAEVDTFGIPGDSFMGLAIDKMEKEERIKRSSQNTIKISFLDWTQLYSCSKAVELYNNAASILEKASEVSERSLVDILLRLKDLYSGFRLDKEAQSIGARVSMIMEAIESRTDKSVVRKSDASIQQHASIQNDNTYVYTSGEIYSGEMRSGVPEGTGEICYPDGARYAGEVRNNRLNGIGAHVSSDGRKYIGGFKNDRFHGEGTLTLSDGSSHSGIWRDGLLYLAVPDDQDFVHLPTKTRFPPSLSGMQRERIINYEITQRGLGVSIGYMSARVRVTVYIYTNRRSSIPEGVDSGIVKKELERAEKDIIQAKEAGQYDSVVKHAESKTGLDIGHRKLDFICSEFQVTEKEIESRSFIYLTGFANHFLKMRFTYDVEVGETAEQARKLFMVDLGQIIRAALRSQLAGKKDSRH